MHALKMVTSLTYIYNHIQYSGSSAAELCDFPMKIKHFETQMVPAHWPAALELENQRQQVGIHGSFVRLQTRGLAMKRCETCDAHASDT